MRAIFTLYLIQALLFNKDLASNIYGSYTGFVYLTPLIGGYIADRYWGNRRSIFVGGVMMSIGQFLLFLSATFFREQSIAISFLIAGLTMLILGNGFFKPNISSMVGQLYKEEQTGMKDSAFTIFYMGINIGAFFSPLICGTLGDTGNPEDFRWGFLAACIGMIIGTSILISFQDKYLVTPEGQPIGMKPEIKKEETETKKEKKADIERILFFILGEIALLVVFLRLGSDIIGAGIFSACISVPIFVITDKTLTSSERKHIWVIYIIAFFVIFFWAAFEQAGASLTYFAEEQTNRNLFGWMMPTSYFQSFNAIFIVIMAPMFSKLWFWLKTKNWEPSSPMKQAFGLLFLAIGYLVIAIGTNNLDPSVRVSIFWLTSLYFLQTVGELCLSPIGLSMVNKLSPVRFASLLMGVWFLSTSAANKFAGTLSSLYPEFNEHMELVGAKYLLGFQIDSLSSFFMIFAIMSGLASLFMFLLCNKLEKMIEE